MLKRFKEFREARDNGNLRVEKSEVKVEEKENNNMFSKIKEFGYVLESARDVKATKKTMKKIIRKAKKYIEEYEMDAEKAVELAAKETVTAIVYEEVYEGEVLKMMTEYVEYSNNTVNDIAKRFVDDLLDLVEKSMRIEKCICENLAK